MVWRGDELRRETENNLAEAWGRVGLRGEKYAKQQLWKGHGVITGTLRRSIHTAGDGYNWAGDNVQPAPNAPERGGKNVRPTITARGRIRLWLGSGMRYALPVEMGVGSFRGYRYLRIAIARLKTEIPGILTEFIRKRYRSRR